MVRGLDVANLDKSVSPADDFYSHANGQWCKANPVPAEYSRWGSFEQLAEENMKVLREILDASAAAPLPAGSVTQKVGDFWRAAMDTAAIEAAGAAPLKVRLRYGYRGTLARCLQRAISILQPAKELLALAEAAASGATPLAVALVRLASAARIATP